MLYFYALFLTWLHNLKGTQGVLRPEINLNADGTLSDSIPHGRRIISFPREHLISSETVTDRTLRRELRDFEENAPKDKEDEAYLVMLSAALIAESREPECHITKARWIQEVSKETPSPVFSLTEMQRKGLNGTTVDGAYESMQQTLFMVENTLRNFTIFKEKPPTREEVIWSITITLKHGKLVHPTQELRGNKRPRMCLIPVAPLRNSKLHPDSDMSIAFQEEVVLGEDAREEEGVLLIARRHMAKGEHVYMWPGRLSNSEMRLRYNRTFEKNPIGIGGNITTPDNWTPKEHAPIFKEFAKFNCTSQEAFEIRLSPQGWPDRTFVQCYRVGWFLKQGWYNPGYAQDEILALMKVWPPPKQYTHKDWLAWTQCDIALNKLIKEYCKNMKRQLKNSLDAETAEYFKNSTDPNDAMIWALRTEESTTFKQCLRLANYVD